jgi:hypothetical protein
VRLTACAAALLVLLAGCGSSSDGAPEPSRTATGTATTAPGTATSAPAPVTSAPATATSAPVSTPTVGTNGATAAPAWLGTRVLPIGPDGYGVSPGTPKELRPRRIITVDLLAPPADGRFHSHVEPVPADVVRRSSWSAACPVRLDQLRYVTVGFVGFDGRAHTGELLLNRSVTSKVITVFERLYQARFPIEEMRITSPADLAAKPTGDGNDTSAFACRPVRGATAWSQHAYGLAIDVDPFDNPYVKGSTVLPELAPYYANRGRGRPGMITPGSPVQRAFASIGWGWGGSYTSKKDWMHFSSTGG